jgi:fatty-acyl-CoA synthase
LVRFEVETEELVRNTQGFCMPCSIGEAGEALGQIGSDTRSNFTGYADKAATEKKIARDVFVRGDAWFRTGDLLKQDSEGYFYFVDRVGDTFRWKGENVSTSEVAERLGEAEGVKEVNVYGVAVPGADGRAGMAALVTGPEFDIATLGKHVADNLPAYARPVFIRLQPEIETTGTLKYRKMDLVEQGFDPAKVDGDPLYVRDPEDGYVRMTPKLHTKIMAEDYRL